jgi:polyribonucleotide nucleotidyltransferase
VGYIDGVFVINPTFSALQRSTLDLVVAGTRDAVVMVEAGAKQVDEAMVLEGVRRAQEANRIVIALQETMTREMGRQRKMTFQPVEEVSPELEARAASLVGERLHTALYETHDKDERAEAMARLREEILGNLAEEYSDALRVASFDRVERRLVRRKILEEGIRPDGRRPKEIRPISSEVGLLPRTHGSGLFTRGQTQVLTIATLGTLSERQKLDTLSPEATKRYIHHYNMPGFASGEVKRTGGPGRREVGHGALAERALLAVVPGEEEFPYTLRLVSEVLSSNGSTSMASVCASTLALMDAGVPIAAPVAGVAMGLIVEGDRYAVLTDIQGAEDHLGDMDFKVAGTAQGITALQMDIKVKGITYDIMAQALGQALEARLYILGKMAETIQQPRSEMSAYAPRIMRITIPVEKIGALIGPGGKTIRSISETYKTTVDVQNDGTVYVGSPDLEALNATVARIRDLTREVEVGAVYTGKVVRIMTFGAFVEILPGKDGLVHISELAEHRVASVEDVVKIGDEIAVKVIEIDAMGRINLSRRAVLTGDGAQGDSPQAEREATTTQSGAPRGGSSEGPRGPYPPRGGSGPSRPDRDRQDRPGSPRGPFRPRS